MTNPRDNLNPKTSQAEKQMPQTPKKDQNAKSGDTQKSCCK